MNIEQQYVNLVREILENGTPKQPTRMENGQAVKVENGTTGLTHTFLQHDMSEGFPLFTHRSIPWKNIRVELEGFLRGVTQKDWFEERGCSYWSWWANPELVKDEEYRKFTNGEGFSAGASDPKKDAELTKEIKRELNDLGPLGYSWNWRNFGKEYNYHGKKYRNKEEVINKDYEVDYGMTSLPNGLPYGYDQLHEVCNKLRTNPYDRRMVTSFWQPLHYHLQSLPSCHYSHCLSVYGDKLDLIVNFRSWDILVGGPSNIASYALLLMLYAKHTEGYTNLKPGKLTIVSADTHIYENQIDGAKEVLKRELEPLPRLSLTHSGDLFDWTYKNVQLEGYTPGDKISFGEITV